ncbi:hypothetical protein LNKW23_16760 [Paralimibaculum aggregatum]|uniref:Uncharacterized protein n=1 Tax=Paralimibaculum aggregatum TaxID=3036245 RepID=A0ABQ6LNS9_9RHOB|nr:hypothetical protein LNKW23_16760 [Limibaculum sp. NKW23]
MVPARGRGEPTLAAAVSDAEPSAALAALRQDGTIILPDEPRASPTPARTVNARPLQRTAPVTDTPRPCRRSSRLGLAATPADLSRSSILQSPDDPPKWGGTIRAP